MNPIMSEPAPTVPVNRPEADGDEIRRFDAMPDTTPKEPKPKRGRGRGLGFGSTMLVLLLGFGGGVAGWYATDQWSDEGSSSVSGDSGAVFQPSNEQSRSAERADAADAADGDQLTPRTIYQRLSPAVAHIDARIVKTETNFFGFEEEQEGSGTGSGFIIDEEGHIVTNAHVVEDAKELTVSLGVDNVKVPATLIGADPSSDIAVIKFDPDAKELEGVELSIAKFGDSTDLQVGDPVVAIGNPFGLDRTLTTGVVSALQRDIPALNDFRIGDVIQTDAAINPGNSGGPLLNSAGEVIGVNSQIQSRSGGFDGVAFAVPSSTVERVAKTLVSDGEVSYAWLGVEGGELTPELVEQLDLGDVTEGVYIANVSEGSPADKAGLEGGRRLQDLATGDTTVEGGDVVLKFDGERVSSMTQLGAIVDAKKPGDKVEVELIRGGDRKTVTVTLGDRSDQPSEPDSDG
jgi:S1-C subfamily serine protease